jgi:ferredoxin
MILVQKEGLLDWLTLLAKDHTIVAPKEDSGILLYKQVSGVEEIVWDFLKTVNSTKDVFFPPTESLVEINLNGSSVVLNDDISAEQTVLFNVRPCDARGMQILDAMFLDKYPPDLNYSSRRKNAVIVGLACNQVGESCFCSSMGGGPDDSSGMDVMLTAVDDGFVLDVITPKGGDIVKGLRSSETKVEKQIPQPQTLFSVPDEELIKLSFKSRMWGDQAEKCISCRVCAYVCPTCRCFDVRDEVVPGSNGQKQSIRIRCWDSCAGEAYRKIAGGHNPRKMKSERLRNRVFCKLYYYPEQYGSMACTGCGRCIDSCPVHVDITEIMSELSEVNQ